MTDVSTDTPKAAPPRRFGWLLPSMVVVALLAGIGGTATFMGMQGDAEPMAAVSQDALGETPAEMQPVVEPVAPVQTGSTTAAPAELALRGETDPAAAAGGEAEPEAEPEAEAGDVTPDTPRMRPAMRRERHRISYSGGAYARHRDRSYRDQLRNVNWSQCWPAGMPMPEMNRGVSIRANTTPTGELSNFRPAGNDNYPGISRCIMGLLEGKSYGPADDGQGHEVMINFSFYD
jgi:hypothetical protein